MKDEIAKSKGRQAAAAIAPARRWQYVLCRFVAQRRIDAAVRSFLNNQRDRVALRPAYPVWIPPSAITEKFPQPRTHLVAFHCGGNEARESPLAGHRKINDRERRQTAFQVSG